LTHSVARKRIDAPLSRDAYEAVVADHKATVEPALAGVEAETTGLAADEAR